MKKYLCIHGHFYQPPRENAWLEEIEVQDSASPFHDWNEKITSECYRPNATSRILNKDNKIIDIVNNYSRISFNFGPTLLSWMEQYAPDVYASILKADRESMEHFGGYGSAMAQVYNHIIMPLANERDQITQVIWGLEDFRSRFGREAEGMWLPETAVNTMTLETLASHGVKFTVLAPRQALRFRKLGSEKWTDGIDSKMHYVCNLPSGKSIILFFYDGERSEDVAFKGLLKNGREFAEHLTGTFDDRSGPQLVHIATDGESYGHHHRHGDMALAFCCQYIEANDLAQLTNYSQFMHLVEAEYEVEIDEDTSWSCYHGIERWRGDCGCGNSSGYHQRWRAPLREGLDWLRDKMVEVYEEMIKAYHPDPWKLRNEYIQVVLNRGEEFVNRFLTTHCNAELKGEERTNVIRLLEMQRQAMLMFTSCGWFFDEVSRIETVQILQYANRAIQLAERVSDVKLEKDFMNILNKAESNIPELENAANIYKEQVRSKRISLTKVGMHYAVASLFDENPEQLSILNYTCTSDPFERHHAGSQKMVVGRAYISSNVTFSEKYLSFAVLYLGQHHIIGSASNIKLETFARMRDEIVTAFQESRIHKVMDIMQYYFSGSNFSFFELFKDERVKVLNKILESSIDGAANSFKRIYNRNYNLLNVMQSAELAIPAILQRNTEIVINLELYHVFEDPRANLGELKRLVQEVKKWQIPLEKKSLSFIATNKINSLFGQFAQTPTTINQLTDISKFLALVWEIQLDPSLNELQNEILQVSREWVPVWSGSSKKADQQLLSALLQLAGEIQLEINVTTSVT